MSTHDHGPWNRPPELTTADLDNLFTAARERARRRLPSVDVDRVIAVAAAAAERRRARRLTALRVAGVALILAVLVAWLIGFSQRGADVVYSVVLFAVPALAVLRWHLAALDGGGLRPWRTARTVEAWAKEATRQVGELTATIGRLDQLARRLDGCAALLTEPGLHAMVEDARALVARVRARLGFGRDGAEVFVARSRSVPAEADWQPLRALDPTAVSDQLRRCQTQLHLLVTNSAGLSGEDAAVTSELCEIRRETETLCRVAGLRSGSLVEALDTLHRLATQSQLQQAPVLGVVRRATSAAAVAVSGWGRPVVERSAIRNQLLTLAAGEGMSWGPAVRRARAVARAEVALAGGVR